MKKNFFLLVATLIVTLFTIEIVLDSTLGDKNKKNLANVWKIIQETSDSSEIIQKYICAHIKIDNVYNGCIFDYLDNQKCPHKVNNIYRLITLF